MECIVRRMLSETDGVPVKTVKSFLTKIPSVFTGGDIVQWVLREIPTEDLSVLINMFF